MKVAEHRENVITEGFEDRYEFTVEASSKAFEILVGKVYSDPIKAIIRELSTNASDAHIAAGNPDTKFEVKLPNFADPTFVIRDYGTGLTPDQMRDLYTVLFRSNKDKSNDFTGCLGLGSKSPFSYVKNFVIESYVDGTYYCFSAYKNERGVPALATLANHGSPTDEPNGLKVTIAVKSEDFSNFRSKAEEVYEYFRVPPVVTGQTINIKRPNYILEGTNWKLRKNDFYTHGAKAVMGNVAYPIRCTDSSLTPQESSLLDCNIDITFKIGDLDIDAGREALHFDSRTVRHVKEALGLIIEELQHKAEDTLASCGSLWEARCQAQKINEIIPRELMDSIDTSIFTWGGVELGINGHSRYIKVSDPNTSVVSFDKKYNGGYKRRSISSVEPDAKIKFYYNDVKTGGYVRSLAFAEDNPDIQVVVCNFTDIASKDLFRDTCGFLESDWNLISSLPKPNNTRKSNGTVRQKTARICQYVPSTFVTHCWKNTTKNLCDGGYYVDLNRGKVGWNGNYQHPSVIDKCIKFLTEMGETITADDIYGIKTATIKQAMKAGTWVNLLDHAKELMEQKLVTFNAAQILTDKHEFDQCCGYQKFDYEDIKRIYDYLEPRGKFYEYCKRLVESQFSEADLKVANIINNVHKTLTGKALGDTVKPTVKLTDLEVEVYEKYHVLGALNMYASFTEAHCEHIAAYVNAVSV